MVKEDLNLWLEMNRIATERVTEPAEVPFKLEDFCTQLAWMGKACPVYPFGAEPGRECEYCTKPGFENYRCPAGAKIQELSRVIVEQGTQEQKDSLKKLADNYAKYGSMKSPPIDNPTELALFRIYNHCISNAQIIYRALGLNEKADELNGAHWNINLETGEEKLVFPNKK